MSPAITTALKLNNDLTIPAIGLGEIGRAHV